jgi:hypothetical protein
MAKKQNFAEEVPEELNDEFNTEEYETTALAQRGSGALINPNAADDLDMEGVRPPYLTLVHGVGEAAETFNPGDLVLQKEYLVCPKGEKLDVIILNIEQFFKQRISNEDWQAGVRPEIFPTKAAAQAAGLQTEWDNDVGPDVSPAMDLVLLIRKPEDVVCGLFGIDIGDGQEYAIAKMSSDKTAYRYLFGDIGLIVKTKLKRSGIFSGEWEFYTELSKPSKTGNRTQVVRARFKQMLNTEVVDGIMSAMGAPANG